MQQRNMRWLILAEIVIVAACLRVYALKDLPAGFFCDEAAEGYNAYAIATTGFDESGKYLPLFVWSFGGYKNPLYIYSAGVPIRLLGLDEFTTRLPAAVFGVAGVLALYDLGAVLFGPWAGLFAALFLTICPWHVHLSRIAFDMTLYGLLFTSGLALLVRFIQGRRTLPAALFLFSLCLYAYAVANLFVPLFLVGFGLLYLPTLWRRWRATLLAVVVALATVAPTAVFNYQNMTASSAYFRNTTTLRQGEEPLTQATRVAENYRAFYSRAFLFQTGDPIVRHAVRGFGELPPFYAPFLLLGALVALLRRDRASKLLLLWAALYPIGPSLMNEIPSATRGFIGVPILCLLTGVGFAAGLRVLGWIGHWRPVALGLQTVAVVVAAYFLLPQVHRYVVAYVTEYPKYSAPTYGGFQYGYRDSIHYMESQRSKYDLLMLTATAVNQPQIFPLFYNRIDPREWSKKRDLGYLISDPAFYADYSMSKRILYQLRPSDLAYFSDYDIKRRVIAPAGEEEFVIAEVRARKRFLQSWLTLGPFDNTDNRGVAEDFIDVRKVSKDRTHASFGEAYWRRIYQRNVRVDLNEFYVPSDPRHPGNPEWICAYALTTLRSAEKHTAFIELAGSADPMQVWFNGRSLTPWPLRFGGSPQRLEVDVQPGQNLLMVKSCEAIGDWFFTARVTDAAGKDVTDIEVLAEIPDELIPLPPAATAQDAQIVEGFDGIVGFRHTQAVYGDYRNGTESWWAYVGDRQGEVVWRTAPCPERKRTLAVFTASMSPDKGEAEIYVNGKYALTIAISDEGGMRSWERGGYRLAFVHKAQVAGNSGIAVLDVPAEQVTPGEPIEVRVVPVSGEAHAWFMIKSYRDTAAFEHVTLDQALAATAGNWGDQVP